MNAQQAIARSKSHDEVVTLDAYSVTDHATLAAHCSGHVLANGVYEFWANEEADLDAQCKAHGCARHRCDDLHDDMEWRVHMPAEGSQ